MYSYENSDAFLAAFSRKVMSAAEVVYIGKHRHSTKTH